MVMAQSSSLTRISNLIAQVNQELPIALDATSIGQNFTVLSINVLDQSCGVPVAGKVVKASGSMG